LEWDFTAGYLLQPEDNYTSDGVVDFLINGWMNE
jgi:hypothetical protein